ncbi:MAG: tetratricopeptide repeat protein [Acidobacteria bacterium]|nr:tetratricopeptide repeat protein [Acidobacteriota bacterium]
MRPQSHPGDAASPATCLPALAGMAENRMKQTTKQITNLFILQSSINESVEVTARYLSILGRQAETNCDYTQLSLISNELLKIKATEETGLYFQSLVYSRRGEGEWPAAYALLSSLINSPKSYIRAASTLSLGVREYRQENFTEAGRLIVDANKLALSNNICAPVIAVYSQIAISAMLAAQGASEQSLKSLEEADTIARSLGRFFPSLLGLFLNNYACAYLEMEDLQAAAYYSDKALAIPSLNNRHEWLRTKQEIQARTHPVKKSKIFIPRHQTYRIPDQVGDLMAVRRKKEYDVANPIGIDYSLEVATGEIRVYTLHDENKYCFAKFKIQNPENNLPTIMANIIVEFDDFLSLFKDPSKDSLIELYYLEEQLAFLMRRGYIPSAKLDEFESSIGTLVNENQTEINKTKGDKLRTMKGIMPIIEENRR